MPIFIDGGGYPIPFPSDPIGGDSRAEFGLGMSSPIVLDLDGDGLEYVARSGSDVFFDIDNDGFAEHVQWMKGDDGFLVRDLNGNGEIDSVAEMFGDNGGTSAYAKLDALDTDNPSGNVLNASDAAWASLRVWQDANENGRVDAGELKTLDSLNITSINTSHTNDTVLGGQPIAGQSTFVMNGTARTAADVLFETDQMNSWFVGNGTPGDTDIDLDTLFLPLSRGYGTLPSLHFAMSEDTTLKSMIEDFATLDMSDIDEIYDRIDAIILQWADAEGIAQNSRGAYFDAAHLRVLETINDTTYVSAYAPFDNNPSPYSTGALGIAYAHFANEIMERLLVQGPLHDVFINAVYDFAQDRLELNDTLANVLSNATANQPAAGTAAYTIYWNEIGRIVKHYHDDLGATQSVAKAAVDAAAGFQTMPIDILGTSGDDIIGSRYGNEVLRGGAGNDTIYASLGEDIHLFGTESGNDYIAHNPSELNGYDAIRFETLNAANIVLSKVGYDLVITAAGIGETITVQDHYGLNPVGGRSFGNSIREIQFANGEIWDVTTIDNVANGGSAPLTIGGLPTDDTITATATTLNMRGGAGADTFVINQSSSKFITITDFNAAEGDVIDISAFTGADSYTLDMNPLQRVGHASFDLWTPTGSIRLNISGHDIEDLSSTNFRSDYLYYGRGQTVYGTSGADTVNGTVANDTIYGNEGNDSIYADNGHDAIYGWTGNDTIRGYRGNDVITGDDGDDSIDGGDDQDSLYGGAGVDTVRGGWGNDFVGGDAGNDSLLGENDHDTLDGGADNDSLYGGSGNDLLIGGAGSDYIDGGDGIDTVSYSASTAFVSIDLAANNHWSGDASWDSIVNVEHVIGSDYNDWIVGNSTANALTGGLGLDSLTGGNGNDTLDAGAGNDQLVGGDGDDLLIGGAGSDYIDGGNGTDTVSYAGSTAWVNVDLANNNHWNGDAAWDNVVNVENVIGSQYSDQIVGNSAANVLTGGLGNDTMTGGLGNDVFHFSAKHGNDTIADFQGAGSAVGDMIQISGSSFGALSFSQSGSNAIITYAGGTITLIGVNAASLTSDDFSFAA